MMARRSYRATCLARRYSVTRQAAAGALLEYAFERGRATLFWPFGGVPEAEGEDEEWLPLPLPHLRAKAPGGVREHSTPPERQRCGAVTSNFTRLTVEVGNNEAAPQLGVDESYVLEVSSEGGVLRAQSEWGALHGLETFTSLVQWDGERLLICEVPIRIDDSPEYRWRGFSWTLRGTTYPSMRCCCLSSMAWQQ